MLTVLKPNSTKAQINKVVNRIKKMGLKPLILKGSFITVVGAYGDERLLRQDQLEAMPFVEKVIPVLKPYKLVSRDVKEKDTIIDVNGLKIGGKDIVIMAGPCAIESKKQLLDIARKVKKLGATVLRAGAFKPRTSPYSFQGMGEKGLKILKEVKEMTGLVTISEVMEINQVPLVAKYVDILQIGTRNMQNFNLLKAVGKINKPVLLKRGLSATLSEFLMSAEYIMSEGNHKVILCERGIRTFCDHTRNTLDLNIVPILKEITHLPVVVDPSHGTGKHNLVNPMSRAAVACGADGLMIEVHTKPEDAVSDGDQSLLPKKFEDLMRELKLVAAAVGRRVPNGKPKR